LAAVFEERLAVIGVAEGIRDRTMFIEQMEYKKGDKEDECDAYFVFSRCLFVSIEMNSQCMATSS